MNNTSARQRDWNDYAGLLEKAAEWKRGVEALKQQPPSPDTTWYAHDILANLWHLEDMVGQLPDSFLEVFRGGHVADIGAADGDLSYFLESRGLTVDLVDWPDTNWNAMTGARALGERLGATNVSIHEVDLDRQFRLPAEHYDLAFFLGILYHLKNPYYVLETLADSARYCFLSTRIARYTADEGLELEQAPLAYLLDPQECNDDPTNYWIFSATGLLRLADRTGWNVLASKRVGDTEHSNPADADHDERMFLVLESRHHHGG